MAKLIEEITVAIHVEYRIVFFPIATFIRLGEKERLSVFGVPVYRKVGSVKSILGINWTVANAS